MDDQQARRVNEAAEKFTKALTESYRAVSDRTVSAQELNAELTQNFFSSVVNNLRAQAESNQEMTQQLADQQQRQREATQALTQETVEAYMDFVNSMFSFYQGSVEAAERSTEEAVERGTEETTRSAREAVSQVDGGPPLEGYDSLNVEQVSQRLEGLSVEELERLRDYETRNKNRSTLIERLNQRIEAGSS